MSFTMPTSKASSTPTNSENASTREKRVALVAWRFNRVYRYDAEYGLRGVSEDEIREGDELGQAMADEYSSNRRHFGDPAYGSWPAHAKQPIRDRVLAMLHGETQATAPAVAIAPAVVVTSLGYQLVARAAKARTMARVLHEGGLPASDADRMTPAMWRQFHAGLKQHGILGAHSTPPSGETIARALDELRRLERLIPVCGAARIHRMPEAA
jgi:hypothetical protein